MPALFSPVVDPENMERESPLQNLPLSGVLGHLQVGIIIRDGVGDLQYCNQAVLDLLGMTAEQLRGSVPLPADWSAVHADGAPFPIETQPGHVALATGKPVRNVVMGIYHPLRRERVWVLVNADPVTDSAGQITFVVSSFSDITERRGFEARLAVTDRLAAMGTLAAGIAHEINNPLAYITANLTYADDELADDAAIAVPERLVEVRHAIQEAREGAQRVRRIVTEMRTLARGGATPGPVAVNRVLESALAAIASEVRPRARLIERLGDVDAVTGDEARLGQVFINLVLNAADAIGEVGKTSGDKGAHEIVVTTSPDGGGNVVIEVRDTGTGIPPELHERIFDPFFSRKAVGAGMGLGLSITHRIVTDMGGTISVSNAPDRGSIFRITLPAAKPDAPHP